LAGRLLEGKTALVTGASRGIGRAVARAFAREGATLAVHYGADRRAAETTREELEGEGHRCFQADLTDPGACLRLVEEVVGGLGGLDVLVNNAGIYKLHAILDRNYDDWLEIWRRTLETNLVGPSNLMFLAGRHMAEHGGGRIVNVSSRGAFRGEPRAPAYGASKAGLNAASQSLAVALAGSGVFVGVVAPGFVETDMTRELLRGSRGEAIRAQSPLGRAAQPEEVARAVLFLAAEAPAFATGAILDVNGASYLRT
jgi:3-oxoacyl-[acyl-carrier protein] reductase